MIYQMKETCKVFILFLDSYYEHFIDMPVRNPYYFNIEAGMGFRLHMAAGRRASGRRIRDAVNG